MNVFTVTFEYFHVSLVNKSINFLKKKLSDPKHLNDIVYLNILLKIY